MPQFGAYLTIIIYDSKTFIAQATDEIMKQKVNLLLTLDHKSLQANFSYPGQGILKGKVSLYH